MTDLKPCPAPVVKPLEWGMDHINNEHWGNSGLLTTYIVRERGNDFWEFSPNNRSTWILPDGPGLEAAKAAAQADYKRRILSALEPGTDRDAVLEEVERLRKALTEVEKLSYMEGKSDRWLTAHMRAVAQEAIEAGDEE